MNEKVMIGKSRLLDLLYAEETLDRLVQAGVDNWEGYSEAFSRQVI